MHLESLGCVWTSKNSNFSDSFHCKREIIYSVMSEQMHFKLRQKYKKKELQIIRVV